MPNQSAQDVAVLIPCYQPSERLQPYMEQLSQVRFAQIVIVDDGSGPDYDSVFNAIAEYEGVAVLRYPGNRGKGFALKHGMRHILDTCSGCRFIVTADGDGQHTVADILAMADALRQDSTGILLGTRDFTASHVPGKSRAGNHITRKVFQVLYGPKIDDTQTGLRGYARELIGQFLPIKGNRYDYEMNQLIQCAIDGIPIRSMPIETVYENNNEDSHFRTVVDSCRIYRAILGRFVRFVLSSAICFLVDYGLFYLINALFKSNVPALDAHLSFFFIHFIARIGIAATVARIVSATVNFLINRRYVFFSRAGLGKSFSRYVLLAVLIIALSSGIVSSLNIGFRWSENLTKIPVDLVLFFLSYYLQRRWVFGGGWKAHAEERHG